MQTMFIYTWFASFFYLALNLSLHRYYFIDTFESYCEEFDKKIMLVSACLIHTSIIFCRYTQNNFNISYNSLVIKSSKIKMTISNVIVFLLASFTLLVVVVATRVY